jgi:hypothetical protein
LNRDGIPARRVDLYQPDLLGEVLSADIDWPDQFVDQRVVGEQAVPMGILADLHRRENAGYSVLAGKLRKFISNKETIRIEHILASCVETTIRANRLARTPAIAPDRPFALLHRIPDVRRADRSAGRPAQAHNLEVLLDAGFQQRVQDARREGCRPDRRSRSLVSWECRRYTCHGVSHRVEPVFGRAYSCGHREQH